MIETIITKEIAIQNLDNLNKTVNLQQRDISAKIFIEEYLFNTCLSIPKKESAPNHPSSITRRELYQKVPNKIIIDYKDQSELINIIKNKIHTLYQ